MGLQPHAELYDGMCSVLRPMYPRGSIQADAYREILVFTPVRGGNEMDLCIAEQIDSQATANHSLARCSNVGMNVDSQPNSAHMSKNFLHEKNRRDETRYTHCILVRLAI